MDLNILWFILIAVLYTGYFILEGFDFGVGMLLPFLGKDDTQRRQIINTVGPHWDANEVWLVVAGGATFAAFPDWYATLFSGFYIPLLLVLVALIFRGVAFEFRSKLEKPIWRISWDWILAVTSLFPGLLFGVAFANLLRGTPIDASMNYVGGFFNLLNPYALLGGLAMVGFFLLLGALFLGLKTEGDVHERAEKLAGKLFFPVFLLVALYLVLSVVLIQPAGKPIILPITCAAISVLSIVLAAVLRRSGKIGWSFILTVLASTASTAAFFTLLFPQVMVSSLNPEWSLTIYNAASSALTLKIMAIAALIFVPIMLVYQGWNYWIFRKRLTAKPETLHY